MPASRQRPNILFIMTDQFRHDWAGYAGASWVRTPNLDRLAARGVRFERCVTNSPICAPARIALATGLEPHRLGCGENDCFLPQRVPTYYQRFRDQGYRVGCVGKLDLAKPDSYHGRNGDLPRVFGWGFTHPHETEGKMVAGTNATPLGPYGFWLQERGLYEAFRDDYRARQAKGWIRGASHDSVLPCDAHSDGYIGRGAAAWITAIPDDAPWHLFVSFVGPHDPFDPPREYADRYRNAAMPAPIPPSPDGKPEWVTRRTGFLGAEEIAVTRRQYSALVELIDEQVGVILAALQQRGMAENTLIVFSSDHGEMLGDHGFYTKVVAYEPSLCVPLLVAGPGVAAGMRSDALVELIDINPTLCELAGVPPIEPVDARSFAPVLRGETAAHRDDTLSTIRQYSMVRTATHKLIRSINDRVELYDLRDDPKELRNLAGEAPELLAELSRRLNRRLNEGGAQR